MVTRPMPVTIVTGALGAGKTTVLNAALRAEPSRRVGVIVNEVGDIGLDGALLEDGSSGLLELTSGCLCCAVRGEFDLALSRLASTDLDQIVVETTGVADPGPVIASVAARPDLVRLDAVLCVADARNLAEQLADRRRPEVRRQLELASAVALSKTDLAGAARSIAVRERIGELNPMAAVHPATRGEMAPEVLFEAAAFSPSRVLEELEHDHDHGGGDHGHVHGEVETIAVRSAGELDPERVAEWLRMIMAFKGPDLNRVKGVLAVRGAARRVVVHGVHGYLETGTGDPWRPDEERASTLVAIGHDLDPPIWRQALEDCRALPTDAA